MKLISLWSYSEKHLLSPHLLFRAIFVGSLSCMKVSHLSQKHLVPGTDSVGEGKSLLLVFQLLAPVLRIQLGTGLLAVPSALKCVINQQISDH